MIARRSFVQSLAALGSLGLSPVVAQLAVATESNSTVALSEKALNGRELSLLDALVETVIPETDTAGASEAGVAAYINRVYRRAFSGVQRKMFTSGLVRVESMSLKQCGRSFEKCSEAEKVAVLTGVATLHADDVSDVSAPESFFLLLKELTVVGYYTSEVGATQELRYQAIHSSHEQCVSLGEDRRAWFSVSIF